MSESLRPHVALASARISAVIPREAGGYAAITDAGIELFDAELAPAGMVPATERLPRSIVEIAGERFLMWDGPLSRLVEGAAGKRFADVDLVGGLLRALAVTDSGFIAGATSEHAVVDRGGTRTFITLEGRLDHGGCAWRGGAAFVGYEGITLVGPDGATRAKSDGIKLRQAPIALACGIAVPTSDGDIAIFDDAARVIARIPGDVAADSIVPFAAGLLALAPGATGVTYWDLTDLAQPHEAWTYNSIAALAPPIAIEGYAVLSAFDGSTLILDPEGTVLATLPLGGYVRGAVPFAGGVAFAVDDQPAITWWRPGAETAETLPHDLQAAGVVVVPAGIASWEGRALYVWRTDAQGPEAPAPIACDYPLGQPIVVGDCLLTVAGAGRHSIRATTAAGKTVAVDPGLSWRPLISRDDASAIVAHLAKRDFAEVSATAAQLRSAPPAVTVDLMGRAMFAPATLSTELRRVADDARPLFLDELALALGTSARALRAALKARKLKLASPRPVNSDYDYLGSFTTSGALTVSDPCYLGKASKIPGISLSKKVAAAEGLWHAFARNASGRNADRTAELAVIHETGFEIGASDLVTTIGVDAGCAGVFDKACPKVDLDKPLEEGVLSGLGVVASSGFGDGMYPVYSGSLAGKVVRLRISFISDAPEVDNVLAKTATSGTARPYSAQARFELGDTITHVKFGTGSVIRIGTDGKIDVRFADATRTLVHSKK